MKKWIFLTICSTAMLFLKIDVALAQAPPVMVLKSRIALANVTGRMDHLGVDVKGHRLFATAIDNNTIEVVDLQTGRQAHTIPNLARPQAAFYEASSNRLFVPIQDGTVKIFDGTTFRLLQTVKLSSDADNVRYDARSKQVLVGYGGEKFLQGKVARGQGDGALAFLDSTGNKTGDIAVDAHPESFQLEKSGTRVFVNVPDHKEVEVADALKGSVLAHWPVTCVDSFPMALDETHHRLFVGCRTPASLVVFNTESGKAVANFEAVSSDDIFYDANKARVYVLGDGSMDVFQQKDPDHYVKIASYPTGPGAWTGLFVPEWGQLLVATRGKGEQSAEILVYETK